MDDDDRTAVILAHAGEPLLECGTCRFLGPEGERFVPILGPDGRSVRGYRCPNVTCKSTDVHDYESTLARRV